MKNRSFKWLQNFRFLSPKYYLNIQNACKRWEGYCKCNVKHAYSLTWYMVKRKGFGYYFLLGAPLSSFWVSFLQKVSANSLFIAWVWLFSPHVSLFNDSSPLGHSRKDPYPTYRGNFCHLERGGRESSKECLRACSYGRKLYRLPRKHFKARCCLAMK